MGSPIPRYPLQLKKQKEKLNLKIKLIKTNHHQLIDSPSTLKFTDTKKLDQYLLRRNDGTTLTARLQPAKLGSILEVVVGDQVISVMEPLTWYQWIWIGFPFLLVVGGGCIGGAIGGACAMINLRLFRSQANPFAQYAATGVVSAVAIAGSILVAGMFHLAIWGFGKKTETGSDAPKTGSPPTVEKSVTLSETGSPKKENVAPVFQKYTLPEDLEKLQKAVDIQFTGGGPKDLSIQVIDLRTGRAIEVLGGHEKIVLEVKKAAQGAEVHVPAGIIAQPVEENSKLAPMIVWMPAVFRIEPGSNIQRFSIRAVNGNAALWEIPREKDRFTLKAPESNQQLLSFFRLAEQKKAYWDVVQVATRVLLNNISNAEFVKNRVGTNTYDMNTGHFITVPIANYEGIMKTRRMFKELGIDPMQYRLFQDQRAQLEEALKSADFDNPHLNQKSIMFNGSLEHYGGEPEVELLLLRYATQHPDLSLRESAIKSLVKIGLDGDAASLLRQMIQSEHREHRFLAAVSLANKGDLRAQPVLAFFGDDPLFGKLVSHLKQTIQNQSKIAPQPNETLLAYWERAVGWESLKGQGDIESIRKLVENREAVKDPWLDKFIEQLKNDQEKDVYQAIREIERRYAGNEQAFKALREVVMTHANKNVRVKAGHSLIDHFKKFDIRGLVQEILENDPEPYVVGDLVRHVVVFGKVEKRTDLILGLAHHTSSELRTRAVDIMNGDRRSLAKEEAESLYSESLLSQLAEKDEEKRVRLQTVSGLLGNQTVLPREKTDAILLRVVQNEKDSTVRRLALSNLCASKTREALPILKGMLQGGTKEEKNSAVSCLDQWKDDAEALNILESFRNDPEIGVYIGNVLKRHGR